MCSKITSISHRPVKIQALQGRISIFPCVCNDKNGMELPSRGFLQNVCPHSQQYDVEGPSITGVNSCPITTVKVSYHQKNPFMLSPLLAGSTPTSSTEDQSVLIYYSVNKELNKWDSIQCHKLPRSPFYHSAHSPMVNPNYSFHGLLLPLLLTMPDQRHTTDIYYKNIIIDLEIDMSLASHFPCYYK